MIKQSLNVIYKYNDTQAQGVQYIQFIMFFFFFLKNLLKMKTQYKTP